MKITRQEFGHEYGEGVYRFGYCQYALLEAGDNLEKVYAGGYLPYSPDLSTCGMFYMARSARVPLKDFSLTSENRRIGKRFDDTLAAREMSAKEMPEEIRLLFLDYFAKRHGPRVMSKERLEGILSWPVPLCLVIYERDSVPLAAVLEVRDETMRHFWFSAYDLSLVEQSLGMWLMLDGARRAKVAGLTHYYLGTVYGEKALYKANLEPLEWWEGTSWSRDTKKLKALAHAETK